MRERYPGEFDGRFRLKVAPYQSCVACFKGDVKTGFALLGEPEYVLAVLGVMGIPDNQALAMISHHHGCDPGKVPDRDITMVFRVCAECAGKAHLDVKPIDGDEILGYPQPDESRMS